MSKNIEKLKNIANSIVLESEQENLIQNFSNIKLILKKNKKINNNPLLKTISFFTENDILLDVDAFWLGSYIEICDSKKAIKSDGCYCLLVDLFKSSMIDALYHTKSIDEETQKRIIESLRNFGLEGVVEKSKTIEEETNQEFDEIDDCCEEFEKNNETDEELFQ